MTLPQTPSLRLGGKRAWIEDKIKLEVVGEGADIEGTAVYRTFDTLAHVAGTHMVPSGGWTLD